MGNIYLPGGFYLYVGSAKRGLQQRILRHLGGRRKCRWHIDYILNWRGARIREVWTKNADEECATATSIARLPETHVVKKGLGSSDCHCTTHFFRLESSVTGIHDRLRTLSFESHFIGAGSETATLRRGTPASE